MHCLHRNIYASSGENSLRWVVHPSLYNAGAWQRCSVCPRPEGARFTSQRNSRKTSLMQWFSTLWESVWMFCRWVCKKSRHVGPVDSARCENISDGGFPDLRERKEGVCARVFCVCVCVSRENWPTGLPPFVVFISSSSRHLHWVITVHDSHRLTHSLHPNRTEENGSKMRSFVSPSHAHFLFGNADECLWKTRREMTKNQKSGTWNSSWPALEGFFTGSLSIPPVWLMQQHTCTFRLAGRAGLNDLSLWTC